MSDRPTLDNLIQNENARFAELDFERRELEYLEERQRQLAGLAMGETSIDFTDKQGKRPKQLAIVERGTMPKGAGVLYSELDRACDIGFRHMAYLHAYKQLKKFPSFLKLAKQRDLDIDVLTDISEAGESNENLVRFVHEISDDRFDKWEQIESNPELKFHLGVIEKINTGGDTQLSPESVVSKRLLNMIESAPVKGDKDTFIADQIIKSDIGEIACTISDPNQLRTIKIPTDSIVALAGFESFEGRGSEISAQKIADYAKTPEGDAPPIPEITIIVYEDGSVRGYVSLDGAHRVAAAKKRGDKFVEAYTALIYFAKKG